MSATVSSPLDEYRRSLEEAAVTDGDPADSLARLRALRGDLQDLLSFADDLLAEAAQQREVHVSPMVREVRFNADLREQILRRGMATEEALDALGMLSHRALDAAAEAGRLEESAFGALAKMGGSGGGGGLLGKWMEKLHPRDKGGKFSEKPGGAALRTMVGRDAGTRTPGAGVVKAKAKPPAGRKAQPVFKTPAVKPADLAVQSREGLVPGQRPAGMSRSQAKQERPRTTEGAKRLSGQPQTPEEIAKAREQDRQKRREALAGRVAKEVKAGQKANIKGKAEPHLGEHGRVSQKALLDYVDQALTTPSTADAHSEVRNGQRVYHADRQQLHNAIIDVLLRQRNEDGSLSASNGYIPSQDQPKVLFMGGGYAAGKSGTRKKLEARGDLPPDALTLDPDQIKSMLPEFAATATHDPEANLRVYREAWDISQELQRRAQERKLNVVVDGITNTSSDEVHGRVQNFVDAGYSEPRIAYVDVPTDMAMQRAAERAKRAVARGDGPNMRHIPEDVMRSVHRDVAATIPAVMSDPRARDLGLAVEVWDNTGDSPVQVASFDGTALQVHDRGKWQTLQDKSHEHVPGLGEGGPTIPQEIQAQLDEAQRIGLNDWPKIDPNGPSGAIFGEAVQRLGEKTVSLNGTKALHDDGQGNYTPERAALHKQIIDDLLKGKDGNYLQPAPDPETGQPRMLFMGGGTASGKSTALGLDENADVVPPNAVEIDPDHIKSLLPEYEQMMGKRDKNGAPIKADKFAANGVHEESSDISKALHTEAVRRGLNVVVDGTGNSGNPTKFAGKMKDAAKDGYSVDVFYVNAATNTAIIRATGRAQKTGRWVPEPVLRDTHANVSRSFEHVKALAEGGGLRSLKMYDTNGNQPKLMGQLEGQGVTQTDPVLFEAFVAKAQEAAKAQSGDGPPLPPPPVDANVEGAAKGVQA